MFRSCFYAGFFALICSLGGISIVSAAEPLLISEIVAQRHGLERPWFLQADIDRGRSRLIDMKLYEGVIYVISDSATVEAVDAETGAKLWAKRIGRPDMPSLPLGVGGDMLAVINGSRLYVANRFNGDLLFEHQVDGAPGGGPAVNDVRVYVPMTKGMIVAYRIDLTSDLDKEISTGKSLSPEELEQLKKRRQQMIHVEQGPVRSVSFQSNGRTLVQPLVMRQSKDEEYASWPTDEGYLYIARIDRHADHYINIQSRIKTDAAITVQPAYLPPNPEISPELGVVFFGSNDGFVTALREDGVMWWRIATGEPIVQPPAIIGGRVYFSTQYGGMYCVDAKPDEAGRALRHWYVPGALQFVAASKKHVYAADRAGNTLVLDAATGERIDSLDTSKLSLKLMNVQTDRLYLAAPEGLVQCLHEIGIKEPLRYDLERKSAEEEARKATGKKDKAGEEGGAKKAAEPEESPKAEEKAGEEETKPEEKLAPDAGGESE